MGQTGSVEVSDKAVRIPRSRRVPRLRENQIELIKWLADGKRYCDIAEILATTEAAVKLRMKRLMDVVGKNTPAGMVAYAFRKGIIK